jgi:hypothetical protein
MDLCDELVGLACNNRAGAYPLSRFGIFPVFPIFRQEDVRLLELGFYLGQARGGCRDAGGLDLCSAPHLTDEAIKQAGLFDRFNQVGLNPQLLQFGGTEGVTHGGEHD